MTIIVGGIKTRDAENKLCLRQDIDKWYVEQDGGNRIQLTLFVEALALIQKRPLDNLLSYFRLAAIHSAPLCEWDDVPQPRKTEGREDRIPGYCVHNDYTFPTWHRVYMMLYERALYDAMGEWIGTSVPANLQATWKEEADKWRLPYWDFARFADRSLSTLGCASESGIEHDSCRLPILCMMPNVRITVFHKDEDPTIESRPNPLYKYVTPKLMGELPPPYTITGEKVPEKRDEVSGKVTSPGFTLPWDKCNASTKYGILDGFHASIWADGGQNWHRANYALNEHPYYEDKDKGVNAGRPVPTLQDLVYRLFQYGLSSWGAFSSTCFKSGIPEKEKPEGIEKYCPELDGDIKNALSLEFIHNNVHNFVGGSQFPRPPKDGIHLWGTGHMSSVPVAAFDPIFFIYHCNIDRLTAMWQILNWDKWFDDKESQKTLDKDLTPFHKDADRNFWKSDDKILEDIATLYGNPTKTLFDRLPAAHGVQYDFVITVIYDKYALNGAPYKINLFLGATNNFRGPDSEGFVASVYNFSGSLESGACGNCQQQKKEGVMAIAQVPATVPVRYYLAKAGIDIPSSKNLPELVYMALNSLGNPVQMNEGDIHVELHTSQRAYYAHPFKPDDNDPLVYGFIKDGRQATGVFN
ncbi:common central domain of tyrosinase-domain-containing protein [Aspergillus coremiiformis]|uniref:tyrosinase n=1 Tax=Aspergillus coremiiformis TaxID=138285 RepID=A0A5N6ZG89_9EURO|nr:common central domain of tyrosinase-domain-containing protein [Aspergillus coremiiformis]